MLISSETTIDAFRDAHKYLLTLPKAEDPELDRESLLVFVFENLASDKSVPMYNGAAFLKIPDYSVEKIPEAVVEAEYGHYQKLLNVRVEGLVDYLKDNPFSKRAIIDVWTEQQVDLNHKAECLIYLMFRRCLGRLDLHVHMRANDGASKALLNFHIFAAIHKFVAGELGEEVGLYYHCSDSYHLYK